MVLDHVNNSHTRKIKDKKYLFLASRKQDMENTHHQQSPTGRTIAVTNERSYRDRVTTS